MPQVNLTNHFLIAMPNMVDPYFAKSLTYICEHNEQGALGLVVNRPIEMTLGALFERLSLPLGSADLGSEPVYFGGPVQTERGFVLHERQGEESPYTSTLAIPGGGLEMTTSKDVLEAMSNGAGPRRVLVTLGYSGWGAGQLEDEIGRNGWLNVNASPEVIFDTPIEQRYDKALSLLGIDPRMLSQEAGHA
jgi:putative transcriptional regulator